MSYIDLVLCETTNGVMLYQAPKFSMLQAKDEVIVKDSEGKDVVVHVLDVLSISKISDEFKFIITLNGGDPFKIVGKLKFDEFDYTEPEGGDADG